MLTVIYVILLIVLLAPIIGLLLLFLAPRPLLNFVKAKANKKLDAATYNANSDYSKPGFLPVRKEHNHVDIVVEGTIPPELNGAYLRNGTNTQFDDINSRRHMFNGDGMLHQVQINDGSATYSNTYIRTPRFEAQAAHGKEIYTEFGDVAGGGKPALVKVIVEMLQKKKGIIPNLADLNNGSATTAIQYHNGRLFCLQETCYPFALDTTIKDGLLSLNGKGAMESFDDKIVSPFTAHPKIDPDNGDWYLYSTDIRTGKVFYGLLSNGELKKFEEIFEADPAIGFLHDYYITENYSVFPNVSLRSNMKGLSGPEGSAFTFDADHKLQFGVIKKDHQQGDSIQWFTTDLPGHLWHTINGWEETREDGGTDIVIFAPVFESYPSDVPIHSSKEPHTKFYKYRLNVDSGEVTEQRVLLDHFYERPSFNTAYVGKKNQYAYLLDEQSSGGIMGSNVLKYDLLNESEVARFDYDGHVGGEALFVAKDNPQAEDDGYLVDILMTNDKAHMVIIDASTMQEVAKLHLPTRVPYGVHGCWLTSQQIKNLA
jgi:carotenoid cleavage dioxygenase